MSTYSSLLLLFRRYPYHQYWWKIALFDLVSGATLLFIVVEFMPPFDVNRRISMLIPLMVVYGLLRAGWQVILASRFLWRRQWELGVIAALHAVCWWCLLQLIGYSSTAVFKAGVGE